ncbi:hypothetical protein ACFQ9X_08120 [Catenulispora yoronensis]
MTSAQSRLADRRRTRLMVLRVLVLALLATLVGRLWYLQVRTGQTFRDAAAANDVRTVVTPRCAATSSTTRAGRWSTTGRR